MNETTTVLFIVVILVGALIGASFVSRHLMSTAVRKVITVFRERGAVTPAKALTAQELGLARRGVMEGMFRMRDYRPNAVQLLARADIVRPTEDGRLYLSEETLAQTRMKDFAKLD